MCNPIHRSVRSASVLCAFGLMAALGVSTEAAAQIAFSEVSAAKGIKGDTYRAGSDHGLGPSWIDYNDDGLPDLFLTNGIGLTAHLFRNDGGGNFTRVDDLLPALPNVDLMEATFGDYDDDGDPDIYISTDNGITGVGNTGPPNILLRNLWVENGGAESTPLFEDVAAAAGVDDLSNPLASPPAYRSTGASFLDYDRDGFLDLYVCHWPRGGGGDPAIRDRLYHNNGDGTFEVVTASGGVDSGTDRDAFRPCLATVGAHLDRDLWPDLWVGNTTDRGYAEDKIFQNRGDGTFVDRTADSVGVGDDSGGAMGIAVADIELDGDWDVYITDIGGQAHDTGDTPGGNPLHLGTGNGIVFQDDTAQSAGIVADSSWGVNFLDVDNDGYEDLYVGMMGAPDLFFRNDQDGTFTDISVAAGFTLNEIARGSALADFDMDGDLDIAMVPQDGELVLYENRTTGAGNWLQLKLRGAGPTANGSNRDAIGALVVVEARGLTMMRQVTSGTGHGQDSGVLHFGLDAAATADVVTVYWPSGRIDVWTGQAANVRLTVHEDTSGPQITGPSPGGLLAGASTTFDWVDGGSGATDYSLELGTSIGASDLFDSGALGTDTTVNATGFPAEGTTVYATLNFDISGTPGSVSYGFTAALTDRK